MMTSCEKAVFKKIVDSSITNIFIPPLIIFDDMMKILLLADKMWSLSEIGHFSSPRERVECGRSEDQTATDQVLYLAYS